MPRKNKEPRWVSIPDAAACCQGLENVRVRLMTTCHKCHELVPRTQYCSKCGVPMVHNIELVLVNMKCSVCGGDVAKGAFCGICGSKQPEEKE